MQSVLYESRHETITATEGQTVFTLAEDPSSFIYITRNGIQINKLSYSVAGKVLTYDPGNNYSSILKADDVIELCYMVRGGATQAVGNRVSTYLGKLPTINDYIQYETFQFRAKQPIDNITELQVRSGVETTLIGSVRAITENNNFISENKNLLLPKDVWVDVLQNSDTLIRGAGSTEKFDFIDTRTDHQYEVTLYLNENNINNYIKIVKISYSN
jgi:hypothetical protein